ncbi:hypothetical protein PPBDW_I21186 [Photobacterium kishitanii]|nr:hypothetical protein PPBDW_I21186 [Photobacterium kishitanii]
MVGCGDKKEASSLIKWFMLRFIDFKYRVVCFLRQTIFLPIDR